MTECPTNPLGINECVQALIDTATKVGARIHIDSLPPLNPGPYPPATFTCPHGNGYWITEIREN
jgi:hypothetical protein